MGMFLDPDGGKRSAGTFSTRRQAQRGPPGGTEGARRRWHDTTRGEITFRDYVETEWLPRKHLEASTRAAYLSYLNKHFYPFFGTRTLNRISPSLVQDWVAKAIGRRALTAVIRKYHVLLSSIFGRAVNDRVLATTRATTPSCPRSSPPRPAP